MKKTLTKTLKFATIKPYLILLINHKEAKGYREYGVSYFSIASVKRLNVFQNKLDFFLFDLHKKN